MNIERRTLYIGCSLTHASAEFKQGVEDLKDGLREEYEVLDFVGLTAGTPQDVFVHDIGNVREADLFVAECSYPSTGLGVELGVAISEDVPTLAVAHKDATVTRLVQGITHPLFSFRRYNELGDVKGMIAEKLSDIDQQRRQDGITLFQQTSN